MDVTIKMIAPKAVGCGHIKVEYSDGKRTLTRVYHVDELKNLTLEELEPALKQVVAKTITDGLAADAKATLTSICIANTDKVVTL